MTVPHANPISVAIDTRYLEDQSDPDEHRYVFAYTVTIRNRGTVPAKLLGRTWVITDANGKVQEVRGEGVVGEQPHLMPGQGFRYTSGAVLDCSPAIRVEQLGKQYQLGARATHRTIREAVMDGVRGAARSLAGTRFG